MTINVNVPQAQGELEKLLRSAMGYRAADKCCGTCQHFVPCDLSGAIGALPAHCTLNPAVKLTVDEHGYCSHYKLKGST